jgi:hypothetical protein
MKESLYLRIITALLHPGLEEEIRKKYPHTSMALSQASPVYENIIPSSAVKVERLTETVKAGFIPDSNDPYFIKKFNETLKKNINKTGFLLRVLSGKEIKKISISRDEDLQDICYKYYISFHSEKHEHNVEVIIESRFLNILYPPLKSSKVHDNIIEEISPFFEKPDLLWPSLEAVVESLPRVELSGLLNSMIQRSDITPYQTGAVITLYPHLKDKILSALSKNIQKDVEFAINRYKGINSITKTDGICALYTVEEALKKLLLEGGEKYSDELVYISQIFRKIKRYSHIQKKDFMEMIDQIEKNRIMEKVIPLCKDIVLSRAFSSPESGKDILKKYIPEKRINEIFELGEKITLEQRIEAEIEFIKACRKVSIMSGQRGHESFSFLIASMNGKDDFYRLLSETGWYTLSTALKGTDIKIIKKVTDNLPHVPSAIIKDILKGRLNPDIVHDEKQIFRARKITVEKILSLYSDCLINLESHDFSV